MIYTFVQKIFPTNIAYRNFIFIPLFFTFYIVLKIFEPSTFFLEQFIGRPVSSATSEAIDIGKRIFTFYKAIAFASFLLILFTRITIIIRRFIDEKELKISNGVALAGFCLLFFQLLGAEMTPSIHLILALQSICLSGFIFHQLKKRDDVDFISVFTWTILISVSLFFLQWQILSFIAGKLIFSLPVMIVLTGIPVYILFTGRFSLNNRILKASRPVILMPLLSFVSIELYMILNQHRVYVSPKILYITGLFFIVLKCYLLFKKSISFSAKESLLQQMFRYWMPVLIAGIACIAFYQPVIQPDIDWFEDANHVLPLQQWFSFGKIPFLDSFSSHTLSDFGFGVIYSIFNGADPMGVFVYRFLMGVIIVLLLYFFIYKITGDGFLATWITLAYPYSDFLIPSYYNLVPVAVIAYVILYEKQTVRRYMFFFSAILFMPLWRVDLGVSTLIAGTCGIIFLLFFVPSFKPEWKKLLKGLTGSFIILLLLVVYALAHSGTHLFVAVKDALAYMSSFQSYGLKALSASADINYYSLYFIFPAVVLLILIYFIYGIIRKSETFEKNIIYSLAIIFFGFFYFSNLQRGLVRHTLAEQWDTAFTSYGFFIICSAVFIRYLNKNQFIRFFVFFIAGTLVISNYVYTSPDLKTNNYYSFLVKRLINPVAVPYSKEKINRITEDPAYKSNYSDFAGWMKKNIPDTATFLDFSNSPMLYYYTKRIVPDYFLQIPHTAHNEYLQDRFIDDLRNYNIPVVIFSNVPGNFWDNLDGIPNTMRHYRICEYIYRSYKPAFIINHHSVWLKKDRPVQSWTQIDSVAVSSMSIKGVTLQDDNSVYVNGEHGYLNYSFSPAVGFNGKKISMMINLSSDLNGEFIVQYKSSSGDFNENQKKVFKIYSGNNSLFVMAEPLENDKDISEIRFILPANAKINFSGIKIYSSDYYPDYVSNQPMEYSLNWIPFIWGNYDRNYISGKILTEETISPSSKLLEANTWSEFKFVPVKDKESGNYIKLNARVISGKQTNLSMDYGNEEEKSGAFSFTLKNDSLFHDYLIRVSSQYNWYSKNNSWLRLYPAENNVEIKNLEILKGD